MPTVKGFTLECQLFDVLRTRLADALPEAAGDSCRILAHPPVGVRIPDLVVLYDRHRARPSRPITLTYFEADVLAYLLETAESWTPSALSAAAYAPPDAVSRALFRLKRHRLVIEAVPTKFTVRRAAFPQHLEIVAVEAKLTRWRDALEQARGYLRFANRSYVAVPGALARGNHRLLADCADDGIGVVAVDSASTSVVLEAARHDHQRSGERVRLIATGYGVPQIDWR